MNEEEINNIGIKPTYCKNCKEKTLSVLSEDKSHYFCDKCKRLK